MKALIFVENGVEDLEFFYPFYRFKEQGIDVDVCGPHQETVTGKHGYSITPNVPISAAKPDSYDILVLPGGKAPEKLRLHPAVIEMVQGMTSQDKIVASICHGGQILVSAGVLNGRKVTCYKSIKDDVIAAGADYSDEPVVVDGNFITSRCPDDLPAFCRELFNSMKVGSK